MTQGSTLLSKGVILALGNSCMGQAREPIFPLIRDLPSVVNVQGWSWQQYAGPRSEAANFWIGTDNEGNQWLTKARGSFHAYREIVFARMVQKLGWSCQSSVFGVFPTNSPPIASSVRNEKIHAIHWFLPEHQFGPCHACCPLININTDIAAALQNPLLPHITDWPKSEIAAFLFGGNEPPGKLFTQSHDLVIIDSEKMFSSFPSDLRQTHWWNDNNVAISTIAQQITIDLCVAVAELSDMDLREFLAVPKGIHISERRRVERILKQARCEARKFSAKQIGPLNHD